MVALMEGGHREQTDEEHMKGNEDDRDETHESNVSDPFNNPVEAEDTKEGDELEDDVVIMDNTSNGSNGSLSKRKVSRNQESKRQVAAAVPSDQEKAEMELGTAPVTVATLPPHLERLRWWTER